MTQRPKPIGAVTDVAEFITDLEAGVFDSALSVALSETAAAVVDRNKKGEVTIKFTIERIDGTHQVRIGHVLKFKRPTEWGNKGEEFGGATVMHVGKGGSLSLAQQELDMGDRQARFPETR